MHIQTLYEVMLKIIYTLISKIRLIDKINFNR